MEFIRRGTTDPSDFIDRSIRRMFASDAVDESEKPQARLSKIYETYKLAGQLIILKNDIDSVAESTPLIKREYTIDGQIIDAEVGIGQIVNVPSNELALVMKVKDRIYLLAVPNNGVEGVPETHGVPDTIGWMESRYPLIHPIKTEQ